jgi:hypothetical protein
LLSTSVERLVRKAAPQFAMPYLRRVRRASLSARASIEHLAYQRLFTAWEALGFHITPATFGSTIPELRTLPDSVFQRRSCMVGVDMREDEQLEFLRRITSDYGAELAALEVEPVERWDVRLSDTGTMPPVDSHVLYCTIRSLKPRRYMEIGSGKSTCITARAALMNAAEGHPAEVVAIEPYPGPELRAGFPGLTRLVEAKVEDVPLDTFSSLQDGDVLFIDSTHHLRIGSDVGYLMLELLPRLPKGVRVHIHDIFLPAEYPSVWVRGSKVFPNEQYFVHAFLLHNDAWRVRWASHFMHLAHADRMVGLFAGYDPAVQGPGSLWMERVS